MARRTTRGFPFVEPDPLFLHVGEHRLHFRGEALCGQRLGCVVVYHPARCGFERRRDGSRRLRHIIVDQPREAFRRVPRNQRLKEEEELMLPFGQSLNGREQDRDIVFLLPFDDGRRDARAQKSGRRSRRGTEFP